MTSELPDLLLSDAAAWRAWLEENHAVSPGVRLVLSRKGGTVTSLFYTEALDEALCFGWIDGQARRRDAVEAAKVDGRWDRAYAGSASAELPDDLRAAIVAVPEAQDMYEVLTSQNRYALYFRLSQIVKPDTRARRIASFVEQLARHEAPHPQKRKPALSPQG